MTFFTGLRKHRYAPGLALLALFWFGAECPAQTGLKVEIVPITQHSMVQAVAFSPDGARVRTRNDHNTVCSYRSARRYFTAVHGCRGRRQFSTLRF